MQTKNILTGEKLYFFLIIKFFSKKQLNKIPKNGEVWQNTNWILKLKTIKKGEKCQKSENGYKKQNQNLNKNKKKKWTKI